MALPRLRICAPTRTGKQWSEAQKAEEAQARRARHQAAITAAEQLLQRLQQASSLEGLAAAAGLKKTAAFFREDTFLTRQVSARTRTLPLPLALALALALALTLTLTPALP